MDAEAKKKLPRWARPIVKVSESIFPFFFLVALVAFILLVVLVALKKADYQWVATVFTVFKACSIVGLLALLVAEIPAAIPGWIGAGAGILLYCSPLLFRLLANLIELDPDTAAFKSLVAVCISLGITALSVCATYLAGIYAVYLYKEFTQDKTRKLKYINPEESTKTEKPSLIPTCWQMSRCRPSVRNFCPNYLDRKTCWKKRGGCFCDRGLANYLIQNVGKGEAQEVIDIQRDANAVAAAKTSKSPYQSNKARRPWRDQKHLCHNCPLFMEHQEYKYKRFSWLSLPICAIITVSAYHYFDMGYQWMATQITQWLVDTLHLPGLNTENSLVNSPFEYVLLGIFALLLLSYVIEFMDRIFLEWRL